MGFDGDIAKVVRWDAPVAAKGARPRQQGLAWISFARFLLRPGPTGTEQEGAL